MRINEVMIICLAVKVYHQDEITSVGMLNIMNKLYKIYGVQYMYIINTHWTQRSIEKTRGDVLILFQAA